MALAMAALVGFAAGLPANAGDEPVAGTHGGASVQARAAFGKLPLYIVENRGLYPAEVAYYLEGADKTLFFTPGGVTIRLKGNGRGWAVRLDFLGAPPVVRPEGLDRQEAVFSYFRGPESEWKTGLPSFSGLAYRELWPGIDLVYRTDVGKLKYEFVVAPGADPAQIRLRYRGAQSVAVTDTGALRVATEEGSFEDAPPVAFQEIDGMRVPVPLAYALEGAEELDPGLAAMPPDSGSTKHTDATDSGGHEFGFHVGPHDPARPLVLDPAILVYCGYIGSGSGLADVCSIAVDGAGAAYAAGHISVRDPPLPVKVGPDLSHNGMDDVWVAKVNPAGTQLIYCGYIGGSDSEYFPRIAVDTAGNAYVAGRTYSKEGTFPVVRGPDLTHNGNADAFVAKVNAAGTGLDYCGYIGGKNHDWAHGIAVDGAGNAYVSGETGSNEQTFPVTVGPDLTYNGGGDGFVAKVNAAGTGLVYCGYIGGSLQDCATGMALDEVGNAYVTGFTMSTQQTFPVLVGPDLTYNGGVGLGDAFVAKVNAAGTGLVYCGYIGGSSNEMGWGIAVDAARNAYVTGSTDSSEQSFPTVVGPDLTYNGGATTGNGDAFVAKVNAAGTGLDYCGYVGGDNDDLGNSVAVDRAGNAYLTGATGSTEQTFPVVGGPDLTYNGKDRDAYVAKVKPAGTGFIYCGYIGGNAAEWGAAIAVDAAGNAYVLGRTDSNEQSFPVRVGPGLTSQGTAPFVAKVALTLLEGSGAARPGTAVQLTLTASDDAGQPYQVGSSLGTGPIALGNRTLGLSPDDLLVVTANDYWPGVFSGYRGVIDAQGQGRAAIHIPNFPVLVGQRIHTAFVTLSASAPQGIHSISNTWSFAIVP